MGNRTEFLHMGHNINDISWQLCLNSGFFPAQKTPKYFLEKSSCPYPVSYTSLLLKDNNSNMTTFQICWWSPLCAYKKKKYVNISDCLQYKFPFKPWGNICVGFYNIVFPKGEYIPVLMKRSAFPYKNRESYYYKNNPFVWSQHPLLKHIIIVVIYFIKKTHLIKIKLGCLIGWSLRCLVSFFTSPNLTQSLRRLRDLKKTHFLADFVNFPATLTWDYSPQC